MCYDLDQNLSFILCLNGDSYTVPSNILCEHVGGYTLDFEPFLSLSGLPVTMLLRNRAVVALGLRMCSSHVTKGPLADAVKGKMNTCAYYYIVQCLSYIIR